MFVGSPPKPWVVASADQSSSATRPSRHRRNDQVSTFEACK